MSSLAPLTTGCHGRAGYELMKEWPNPSRASCFWLINRDLLKQDISPRLIKDIILLIYNQEDHHHHHHHQQRESLVFNVFFFCIFFLESSLFSLRRKRTSSIHEVLIMVRCLCCMRCEEKIAGRKSLAEHFLGWTVATKWAPTNEL